MKFVAELSSLKTHLADVVRFANGTLGSTLTAVHAVVDKTAVVFTGFDGETGARTAMTVAAGGTDGTAMLGRGVIDYITALPDGTVTVEVANGEAKVTSGKLSAKFRVEDPANYPAVTFLEENPVVIDASELRSALRQAKTAAASPTANRPALSGVLFEVVASRLNLVATDSYRLSLDSVTAGSLDDGVRCTLPIRAVSELERLLGRVDKVELHLTDSNATFAAGEVKLTTRLIAQAFPNYQPIIPPKSDASFQVAPAEVAESIKRLKIVAPRENRAMKVTAGTDQVVLSTRSAAGDTVVEPVAATITGTPSEFSVNIDYFAEAIATLSGDLVEVAVTDALKPLVLTSADAPTAKHVVMPVRV